MRTRQSTADSRVTLYEPEDTDAPVTTPKKRKATSETGSRSPKKAIKLQLDTPHPAPLRWRECLDVIEAQRKTIIAPVDTMGCDDAGKLEDDSERMDTDERSRRFQTLVSLMLSSQTKGWLIKH